LILAPPIVEVHAVDMTYERTIRALAGVELTVRTGELVSIVGPSGCGKSTLLRAIAGLLVPTAGTVSVAGSLPAGARPQRVPLSFVFQDPTLLAWRTVRSNVRLPLELMAAPRTLREGRINAVLDLVGLADFADRYPDELSGGMRMRASLARALVTEPELLLLDEPFGALDDITRHALGEELLRLRAARGWTGVFITHNIAEAVYLSDRVLVMSPRPGRIVAEVSVPLAASRTAELRATAEFARLVGEVTAELRRAAS
jgi:NitT/TauT family transport system ATP-binding protein